MAASTANHVETFKLLAKSDDDSASDEDDDVVLPPPPPRRKLRTATHHQRRRLLRSGGIPASGGGGGRWVLRLVAGALALVAVGLLGLLFFTLQRRVDALERRLADVEVGSKNTPEEFHAIHARLKSLEDTGTGLRDNLTQTMADLATVSAQVQKLITTVDRVRQSIASAPQIETLPKAVANLQESVASMGSKITALELNTKEVKSLAATTSQLLNQQQDQLQRLAVSCNKTDLLLDAGWKDFERVRNAVDLFNASLDAEIRRSEADKHQLNEEVAVLHNLTLTLSTRVDELRNTCHSETNCSSAHLAAVHDVAEQLQRLGVLYQNLLERVDNNSHSTNLSLQSDHVRLQALHDQFLDVNRRLLLMETSSDVATSTSAASPGPSTSPMAATLSTTPSPEGDTNERAGTSVTRPP